MMQMSFDDYTQTVESVIRAENGPQTGAQLKDHAEHFYRKNGELLGAHERAALLHNNLGVPMSARTVTALVRQIALIGAEKTHELVDIYASLDWERDEPFAISDHTTAWVTRWLEKQGFQVTKAKSKLDSCDI